MPIIELIDISTFSQFLELSNNLHFSIDEVILADETTRLAIEESTEYVGTEIQENGGAITCRFVSKTNTSPAVFASKSGNIRRAVENQTFKVSKLRKKINDLLSTAERPNFRSKFNPDSYTIFRERFKTLRKNLKNLDKTLVKDVNAKFKRTKAFRVDWHHKKYDRSLRAFRRARAIVSRPSYRN